MAYRTEKSLLLGRRLVLREALEDDVAALHGGVERVQRRLLAAPDELQLLVDDDADLREVAQANALAVAGRILEQELAQRDLLAGVRGVEAGLARQLVGAQGHGHVAGLLVP